MCDFMQETACAQCFQALSYTLADVGSLGGFQPVDMSRTLVDETGRNSSLMTRKQRGNKANMQVDNRKGTLLESGLFDDNHPHDLEPSIQQGASSQWYTAYEAFSCIVVYSKTDFSGSCGCARW